MLFNGYIPVNTIGMSTLIVPFLAIPFSSPNVLKIIPEKEAM